MIYLHKIIPLIFSPLFFIIGLILLGLIINSKKISLIGIAVMMICSLPIISDRMIAYLETGYELIEPNDVSKADAIVVLSGMVVTIKVKNNLDYEWSGEVDRIFAGIDLMKEKKAPFLILTRGKYPWSVGVPEGEYLRDVAIKFGIPENKIILTENVENTDQEAKAIKKIISISNPRAILVTSAFHMARAITIFEEVGINIIPFPVDFQTRASKITFMDFIPSASSLSTTSFVVRELIGRTYYNFKYSL